MLAGREVVVERLGRLLVPLLAVAVFLFAASHVGAVWAARPVLAQVAGVFIAYLVAAALLGAGLGRLARLPAVVIVFQSFVELFGMVA